MEDWCFKTDVAILRFGNKIPKKPKKCLKNLRKLLNKIL